MILKHIKHLIVAILSVTLIAAPITAPAAFADEFTCPEGSLRAGSTVEHIADCNVQEVAEGHGLINVIMRVIDVILGFVALIAVFVIILGGIQFTTSTGDPAKTKKAKDTILYGVVGLVVALLAFAIVNFVLRNVFASDDSAAIIMQQLLA